MMNKRIVARERLRNRRAVLIDVNDLVVELVDIINRGLSWCGLVCLNKLDNVHRIELVR